MRLTRVAAGIVLLWFVSWTPYAVVALLGITGNHRLLTPLGSLIPALTCKLAACIDPYVYALSHPRCKRELYSQYRRLAYWWRRKLGGQSASRNWGNRSCPPTNHPRPSGTSVGDTVTRGYHNPKHLRQFKIPGNSDAYSTSGSSRSFRGSVESCISTVQTRSRSKRKSLLPGNPAENVDKLPETATKRDACHREKEKSFSTEGRMNPARKSKSLPNVLAPQDAYGVDRKAVRVMSDFYQEGRDVSITIKGRGENFPVSGRTNVDSGVDTDRIVTKSRIRRSASLRGMDASPTPCRSSLHPNQGLKKDIPEDLPNGSKSDECLAGRKRHSIEDLSACPSSHRDGPTSCSNSQGPYDGELLNSAKKCTSLTELKDGMTPIRKFLGRSVASPLMGGASEPFVSVVSLLQSEKRDANSESIKSIYINNILGNPEDMTVYVIPKSPSNRSLLLSTLV